MRRSRSNTNSGRNNNNSMNNSVFDPFSGFGGFGFGQSIFQDFFGHDPFDDPFFNRPFGSLLEHRPSRSHQEGGRPAPLIEEVLGDHVDSGSRSRSSQEPIVEHPDDDHRPDHSRSRRKSGPVASAGDGGIRSYSFQSSTFSSSGPDGGYYTSSTSRRRGPNGVLHEEHFEKDSASRTETQRVSLGLNDKGHSVTRKRNAEGREDRQDILHNLEESEVQGFDERWASEAERSLGFNRSRARALGGGNHGTRSAPALGWSGSRQA